MTSTPPTGGAYSEPQYIKREYETRQKATASRIKYPKENIDGFIQSTLADLWNGIRNLFFYKSAGREQTRLHVNVFQGDKKTDPSQVRRFDIAMKEKIGPLDAGRFAPLVLKEKDKADTTVFVNINSVAKRLGVTKEKAEKFIRKEGKLAEKISQKYEDFNTELKKVPGLKYLVKKSEMKLLNLQMIGKNIEEKHKLSDEVKNKISQKADDYKDWVTNVIDLNDTTYCGPDGATRTVDEQKVYIANFCYILALCEHTGYRPSSNRKDGSSVLIGLLDPNSPTYMRQIREELDEAHRRGEESRRLAS